MNNNMILLYCQFYANKTTHLMTWLCDFVFYFHSFWQKVRTAINLWLFYWVHTFPYKFKMCQVSFAEICFAQYWLCRLCVSRSHSCFSTREPIRSRERKDRASMVYVLYSMADISLCTGLLRRAVNQNWAGWLPGCL